MKKTISIIFSILIISLAFTTPIFAANENTRSNVAANVCGSVNIKDSLVLSIVSMCLPGILEKTQEWRQIQCQAVVCNYEAIKFGLDPSFCRKQQEYLTCSYIVGEVFAIPPMSVLEYYKDLMAGVLANPIGAVYSAAVKVSRLGISGSCNTANPGIVCSVFANAPLWPAVILVTVTDALYVVQTLQELFTEGFDSLIFDDEINHCEEVENIKSELEEILGIKSDESSSGGFLGFF